jgi:exonuclease III
MVFKGDVAEYFTSHKVQYVKVRDSIHYIWENLPQEKQIRSDSYQWKSPSSRTRRMDYICTSNAEWGKRSGSNQLLSKDEEHSSSFVTNNDYKEVGVRPHESRIPGKDLVSSMPQSSISTRAMVYEPSNSTLSKIDEAASSCCSETPVFKRRKKLISIKQKRRLARRRKLNANRKWHLRCGSYNVVTLNNEDKRTLLENDLDLLKLDIVAFQETKLMNNGQTNLGFGMNSKYQLYYSGDKKTKINGVGIAIKKGINLNVTEVNYINDRIMYITIERKIVQGKYATTQKWRVVSVYAPTNPYPLGKKLQFYRALDHVIPKDKNTKVIILGDFNARVNVLDYELHRGIMGKFGLKNSITNQNGSLLLDWCQRHNLCLFNTFFKAKSQHGYATWYHRSSKKRFTIDYVIGRRRELNLTQCASVNKNIALDGCDHNLLTIELRLPKRQFCNEIIKKKSKRNVIKFPYGCMEGNDVTIGYKFDRRGLIHDTDVYDTQHNMNINVRNSFAASVNLAIKDVKSIENYTLDDLDYINLLFYILVKIRLLIRNHSTNVVNTGVMVILTTILSIINFF